jgi:C1A family cysteine protease
MLGKNRSRIGFAALLGAFFVLVLSCAFPAHAQKSDFAEAVAIRDIDARIAELNRIIQEKGYHWKAGRTSMSHLTNEEWKTLFPPLPPIPDYIKRTRSIITASANAAYPVSLDWRDSGILTPAKHQSLPHYCASCYAHAAVAQLEAHMQLHDGIIPGLDLSEQQIMSCKVGGNGCHGGNFYDAYAIFESPGALSESSMPYEASNDVVCLQDESPIQARIADYFLVSNDINSIKEALLSGPIYIGMYADQAYKDYVGGCWADTLNNLSPPTHAMLCVGWNDTLCAGSGAWIIKNSWGSDWGEDGYGYVQYGTANFGYYASQMLYLPNSSGNFFVEDPRDGDSYFVGASSYIRWHCTIAEVDHFTIGYDDGVDYHVIQDDISADQRIMSWTIPNDPSSECKVIVRAFDASDTQLGSASSQGFFIIQEARQIAWDISGAPVSAAVNSQRAPQLISDGGTGAIAFWEDSRSGSLDIYAQRLDAAGAPLWTTDGVAVCTGGGDQNRPQAIPDGAGGAIVVWEDAGNIYAQRLNASGGALWTPNGVTVCSAAGSQSFPAIISDGSGGALIAWQDYRDAAGSVTYVQRINAQGAVQWTQDGVQACSRMPQLDFAMAPDGSGGAIIAWADYRFINQYNYFTHGSDIFVQRIAADGTCLWQTDGVAVCTALYTQRWPRIVSDNAHGAVIAWTDARSGGQFTNEDLYAQRIDAGGNLLWANDGVPVCSEVGAQESGSMIDNGIYGGAAIAWVDYRTSDGNHAEIYVQSLRPDGSARWTAGGVAVSTGEGARVFPQITRDGTGGVVVAWNARGVLKSWNETGKYFTHVGSGIYAQRVNAAGAIPIQWSENGEPIGFSTESISSGPAITVEHGNNIFISWERMLGGVTDLFAQRLAEGYSSPPSCDVTYEFFRVDNGQKVNRYFMNGCPQGDSEFLRMTLEFDAADLTRDIDRTEIVLVKPDTLTTFWSNGTIYADSNVSLDNVVDGKVKTTITHAHFSRDWPLTNKTVFGGPVDILLDGDLLGSLEVLTVKSPDYTGDGNVNSNDMYYFNLTYNKSSGQTGYNAWFDFDADNKVKTADYNYMGVHQNHHKPTGYLPSSPAGASEAGMKLIAEGNQAEGTLRLALYLENANGITTACLGLNSVSAKYEFVGWKPSAQQGADMLAAPVVRAGREVLFVSAFDVKLDDNGGAELGTVEFAVKGDTDPSTIEKDFAIQFANVRYEDGTVKYLGAEAYEFEQATPRPINNLADAYPNPFNPSTTIKYSLANDTPVNLSIYNVNGQLIRTLVNKDQKSREYSVVWNGKDNRGNAVQSGVYFYRITTNSFAQSKKFVLLR